MDGSSDRPQPVLVTLRGGPQPARGLATVELDLAKFHNGRWALQLDQAFARRTRPVVLLAHGVACLALTWWAQLSPRSYLGAIEGALFHAPLDVPYEQAALAATIRSGPTCRLPFPSVVVSDAAVQAEALLKLADAWGSRFVDSAAPDAGTPTNRQGPGSAVEDMLLGHLGLLTGVAVAAGPVVVAAEGTALPLE